jgi:hypothetical protein
MMMSSAIPSAKNSCSESLPTCANGRTAIEGLSGKGRTDAPSIGSTLGLPSGSGTNPVDPDRSAHIFEALFAKILEGGLQPSSCVFLNPRRHANATRLGKTFEAWRDIHAVAEDVVLLDDDVAHVDADAELDATLW